MTAKQQLNARLSDMTRSRLDDLTAVYGTQAEAMAVAIDRLWQQTYPNGLHVIADPDDLAVGQRVQIAGWPEGTVEALHRLGADKVVHSVRVRFDTGAALVVSVREVRHADVS